MNQPTMRDADMPLLDRIDAAIKRVTSGHGQMRVPVEATDPDMALLACKLEIERLRAGNAGMTETIEWVPVSERMPDADETVMIYAPDDDPPVMEGYFDGECWCVIPGIVGWHVTHWAEKAKGPRK